MGGGGGLARSDARDLRGDELDLCGRAVPIGEVRGGGRVGVVDVNIHGAAWGTSNLRAPGGTPACVRSISDGTSHMSERVEPYFFDKIFLKKFFKEKIEEIGTEKI